MWGRGTDGPEKIHIAATHAVAKACGEFQRKVTHCFAFGKNEQVPVR